MKASKIKLFFVRKRIDAEETLDDLKIRSKLVEGQAENKFDPEEGMISHVKDDDMDYQFDGEEWKPVNKKKFAIIWVAIGAVAALAVSLSIALPIALSPRNSKPSTDPSTSQSSPTPGTSGTSSEPGTSGASSDPGASNSSVSSSTSSVKTNATVTFDTKGGTAIAPATVALNAKVTAPADPTNGDLLFGGWYLAEQPSVAGYYDFDNVVTDDFALYAQWVQPYVYALNETDEEKPFYEVSDNVAYRVADVVVPGVYKGVPVKRIDYGFSSDNDTIKTLAIEEGMEICDCDAFRSCPNLESVSFPNTLKQIREGAFGSYYPSSLHFPSGVERIGPFTFQYCDNLTELTFDDSKTNLALSEYNFWAPNLKTVKLPEGLTELGSSAFAASGLETIFLPSTLKETGRELLYNVLTLQKVYSKVSRSDLEKIWDGTGPLFEKDWYLYAEGGVTPANTNGYFYYYDDQGAVQEKTVSSYPITISFHTDGGSEVDALHPAFEEALALPTPTKEGYAFDAWYTSENPGYVSYVSEGTKAINSMELYAHWVDGKLIIQPNAYHEGVFDLAGSQEDIVNAVVPNVYHGNQLDLYYSDGAFKNRLSLKSVTYEGTEDEWIGIEDETFSGCTSLEYVVLEGKLQYLSTDAFKDCTALAKVYEKVPYDPNRIYIADGNDDFKNATRYKFTANGAAETGSGNWWYYDAGHNIVELIIA